mmetsp:Transcript_14853/g.30566  ORF Transcript_14853/g.30566 Transcript_14853/m.30566 type:complete len:296 (-) Transcript_14853:9-896(-)
MAAAFPIKSSKKRRKKKKQNLPQNPDLSHFASVEDYLEYVQSERDTIPAVSVAPMSTISMPPPPSTQQPPSTQWCESFAPRPPSLSAINADQFVATAVPNFRQLQKYISALKISKNYPPMYPSAMSTVGLPPMKDFLGWNIRLFHGGVMDLESNLAQALYVVPCTRAEYDNTTLGIDATPLEPKLELYKRMDLAMLTSVMDHIGRIFVSSSELDPLPPSVLEYLKSQGQARAQVLYGLLASLPIPLHRDTQANLRALMRGLCKIRALEIEEMGKSCEVLLSVGVELGIVGKGEVF